MKHGRGDSEHPNYVTITQFDGGDYFVTMMKWHEGQEEYEIEELAGCTESAEVAMENAKEWAAEEGVEVR